MHLLATHDDPAAEAVRHHVGAHPGTLELSSDPLFVRARGVSDARRVALVSGGGSGHEPMHVGYVGPGGLDAAVPGRIFASPHSRQVHAACRAVARPGGVLLVVKNYTGDVVNFAIAAERLRSEGMEVGTVVVADDVATDDGQDEETSGMRGTAATVVVEQLLASAADDGAELDALVGLGDRVVARSRSVAAAVEAHHRPGSGELAFALDGRIELGVGIHGERARETVEPMGVEDLVTALVARLLPELPDDGDGVALLVNDLGALSGLELSTVTGLAAEALLAAGRRVALVAQGAHTTALDMRGVSVTLTALQDDWADRLRRASGVLELPRWDAYVPVAPSPDADARIVSHERPAPARELAVLQRLLGDAVTGLTRLDEAAGDGDFGDNLQHAVTQAAARLDGSSDEIEALRDAFLDDTGGSSGPLFGLLLQHVAAQDRHVDRNDPAAGPGPGQGLGQGLRAGVEAIGSVGGAQVGDRTMLDALVPAADALDAGGALRDAVLAAIEGARSTTGLTGRRGRARYVGDRAVGLPDPGAVGAVLVLCAVVSPWVEDAEGLARALVAEVDDQLR